MMKNVLAHVLYYSGLLNILARIILRNKAVVLTYHRVLREPEISRTHSHPAIIVKSDSFALHLSVLTSLFRVLTLDEFVDHFCNTRPLPSRSCLVTFDDGWHDNYTEAFPILRNYSVPATIFLPTDFIGGQQMFWQECLSRILIDVANSTTGPATDCMNRLGLSALFALPDVEKRDLIRQYVMSLKAKPLDEIYSVIDFITRSLNNNQNYLPSVDGFMDWTQVKLMNIGGITFGSHGTSHRILTQLSPDEVLEELTCSRRAISEKLGYDVVAIAYPNGDCDDRICTIANKAGFKVGFSTERGFAKADDNPLKIRRINIHEHAAHNKPLFLARILGIF